MNSKNTWIWFVVAAALFAFIFSFQHFSRSPTTESSHILPDLRPDTVTSIQVIPANALEIRAERTNGAWLLTKPIVYPAQPAAVEALLRHSRNSRPSPASVPVNFVNTMTPTWNTVLNRRKFRLSSQTEANTGNFR